MLYAAKTKKILNKQPRVVKAFTRSRVINLVAAKIDQIPVYLKA